MNGVHDMGGMHGFGPVVREHNEPVFHAPWEGRVLALRGAAARLSASPSGKSRDIIEHIEPLTYLAMSYYERFLVVAETLAIEGGAITKQELDERTQAFETGRATLARRKDAAAVEAVRAALKRQLHPAEHGSPPRFSEGDAVVALNLNWPGHNRLPRYVRGKRGVVERVNGFYAIEDAHADALGPSPQAVYTVRFTGPEVWGPECEPNMYVYLELWEGYLEPAGPTGGNK